MYMVHPISEGSVQPHLAGLEASLITIAYPQSQANYRDFKIQHKEERLGGLVG